jgi:hypothetical protein
MSSSWFTVALTGSYQHNTVTSQWLDMGFGLIIEFIEHLELVITITLSLIRALYFTTAHVKSCLFTSHCLVMDPNIVLFCSLCCRPCTFSQLIRGLLTAKLLLAIASTVILGSESGGTRYHILLFQIRDLPFRRLIRLAGLRWWYSTPPLHGIASVVSKSKSHCDWWSVSQSVFVSSPAWGSWSDIYYCLTITVLLLWGALSDDTLASLYSLSTDRMESTVHNNSSVVAYQRLPVL